MVDLYRRILVLSKSTVFAGINTEDLRVVARELDEDACFAGERIFDINEPSDRMYFIESGNIGISIHKDPRVREYHSTMGPGEFSRRPSCARWCCAIPSWGWASCAA